MEKDRSRDRTAINDEFKMKKIALIVIVLVLTTTFVSAQTSNQNRFKQIYDTNKTLVNTNNYQYVANWVFNGKKREELKEDYTLRIENNSAELHLGKLTNQGKAFKLSGKLKNYTATSDDAKQSIFISFKVENYNITIRVRKNGSATLLLDGKNSQYSYRGYLKAL